MFVGGKSVLFPSFQVPCACPSNLAGLRAAAQNGVCIAALPSPPVPLSLFLLRQFCPSILRSFVSERSPVPQKSNLIIRKNCRYTKYQCLAFRSIRDLIHPHAPFRHHRRQHSSTSCDQPFLIRQSVLSTLARAPAEINEQGLVSDPVNRSFQIAFAPSSTRARRPASQRPFLCTIPTCDTSQ